MFLLGLFYLWHCSILLIVHLPRLLICCDYNENFNVVILICTFILWTIDLIPLVPVASGSCSSILDPLRIYIVSSAVLVHNMVFCSMILGDHYKQQNSLNLTNIKTICFNQFVINNQFYILFYFKILFSISKLKKVFLTVRYFCEFLFLVHWKFSILTHSYLSSLIILSAITFFQLDIQFPEVFQQHLIFCLIYSKFHSDLSIKYLFNNRNFLFFTIIRRIRYINSEPVFIKFL